MRGQSIHGRVTLLFPGALGDMLLALPAWRALRARHRDVPFTIVVAAPLRTLVDAAGIADATASLDGPELARVLAGGAAPAWLGDGAVVYSWLGATDAEIRARLAAHTASSTFFRVVKEPGAEHAAQAYARQLDVCTELRSLEAAARFFPPTSARADALVAGTDAPLLVVHPGAGAPAKRWPRPGFDAVAAWWRARGGRIVAVLGPAEHDVPGIDRAEAVREWPLPDVAAVLARSAVYAGNDSGVSHLAASVGARGVVLFGPTAAHRWRPLGDLTVVHVAPGDGEGCPMEALPASRVIAACAAIADSRRGSAEKPAGAGTSP